jgi:hypothetical protein
MDPQAYVQLILVAISGVAQVISWIKGQSGISDDAKAAQVQQLLAANDALYASLKQALTAPAPATPPATS